MGADAGYPAVQPPGHSDVEMQAPAPAVLAVQYAGLYPAPVEGVPVKGPARSPGVNEVVLGYEICEPKYGHPTSTNCSAIFDVNLEHHYICEMHGVSIWQ